MGGRERLSTLVLPLVFSLLFIFKALTVRRTQFKASNSSTLFPLPKQEHTHPPEKRRREWHKGYVCILNIFSPILFKMSGSRLQTCSKEADWLVDKRIPIPRNFTLLFFLVDYTQHCVTNNIHGSEKKEKSLCIQLLLHLSGWIFFPFILCPYTPRIYTKLWWQCSWSLAYWFFHSICYYGYFFIFWQSLHN